MIILLLLSSCSQTPDTIDLSGSWQVQADSITRIIQLPGSLSENRVGEIVRNSVTDRLSEQYSFAGKTLVCTSDLFGCKDEPEVRALFGRMVEFLRKDR